MTGAAGNSLESLPSRTGLGKGAPLLIRGLGRMLRGQAGDRRCHTQMALWAAMAVATQEALSSPLGAEGLSSAVEVT